jgi:alpha-galactosidase
VLRAGLEALRQAAGPGTFLLGATCPLGSPIGVLDAMRVEPDVDVGWHPSIFGVHFFVTKEPDFPSARNATHNALARSFIHRRWWINDPDCLLLRPDTRLTLAEVQTLASVIALSGGSLFLSDKLAGLPTERLRIAQALLPLIRQRPRLLDWLDEPTPRRLRLDLENAGGGWHILALFNWKDMPANLVFRLEEFHLPVDRPYHAREYWSGEVGKLMDGSLAMKDVPAHGCRLLALRPALGDRPQYLGSDLHISQGLEIASWEETKDPEEGTARLYLQLERPGRAQGVLDLYLPQAPQAAWLGAEPIQWIWIGESVYRFSVQFLQGAEIRIHYPFG